MYNLFKTGTFGGRINIYTKLYKSKLKKNDLHHRVSESSWMTLKLFVFFFIFFYWRILFRVNLEEHVFSVTTYNRSSSSTNDDSSATFMWWSIDRRTCYVVFAIFTLMMIVATIVRSFTFISVCMKSSMTLHNRMFSAITTATMYFFNTNSSGKIH